MKRRNKIRRYIPIVIILLAAIIICSVIFLIDSFKGNYNGFENIDNAAEKVSLNIARDSNILVVNGAVIGATKDRNWISADKYYEANSGKENIEVNLFSQNNKYGTYSTANLRKSKTGLIYTTITKDNLPSNYLAVSTNISSGVVNITKQEATKQDEEYVKQALGGYKILNAGVNITEVYTANINNVNDKIICVTAKESNILGIYSAVIFVSNNKPILIKYSHVKDTDNSDRWPIYSLKFVHNLDGVGTPEIILEEVTGSDVRYTVQELRDNNFYQVLSVSVEI